MVAADSSRCHFSMHIDARGFSSNISEHLPHSKYRPAGFATRKEACSVAPSVASRRTLAGNRMQSQTTGFLEYAWKVEGVNFCAIAVHDIESWTYEV